MIHTFLLTFLAFWVALLPVYLWGYGITILSQNEWNRSRFWMGGFAGVVSVGLVYLLDMLMERGAWYMFLGVGVFLLTFYSMIVLLTFLGSQFARVFLRKIAIVHVFLIFSLIGGIVYMGQFTGGGFFLSTLAISILLASMFEESAKHLASIGLIGRDFQFSKQEIILFTFFVAIGFVFVENILYFIQGNFSVGQWVFRSFFTLILHVFAAVVCSYFWWRALSYRLFSVQYIVTFLFGFVVASTIHMFYNLSLEKGSISAVLIFVVIGYITFTRLIMKDSVS